MMRIRLTGRHATGDHEYATVDDDMFAFLSQWRWKAKPNGNGTHVYAARNAKVDGRNVLVRMHRVVAGYDGGQDIDHIDRNPLNNQRANLRVVSRSVNVRNSARVDNAKGPQPQPYKPVVHSPMPCKWCERMFTPKKAGTIYCDSGCGQKAKRSMWHEMGHTPPSNTAEAQRARRQALIEKSQGTSRP